MAPTKDGTTVSGEADTEETNVAAATACTTPATSTSIYEACHAALDTSELLESIILSLPPIKIFEIQRVSSEWRDAIAASIKVQQRMFLRPITENKHWVLLGEPYIESDPDHLINHRNVEFVISLADTSRPTTGDSIPKERIGGTWTPAKLCPLLARCTEFPNSAERVFRNDTEGGHEMELVPLLRRAGSWRNIYLTNPPSKDLWLDSTVELPRAIIGSFTHLHREEGLRLGDVADRVFHCGHDYRYLPTTGGVDINGVSYPPYQDSKKYRTLDAFLSTHGVPRWDTDTLASYWVSVELSDVVLATDEELELAAKKGARAAG